MAKATIIIPTHNRSKYLQRLLDYFHKYGSDFNIIIADSSPDENKKVNKKIILSFPDLNIQYIDKYSEEINPYYKFADIVNYAKKKYCVFCGDDDFITPNGIRRSVDFLEKNPDFTVAHGYYMAFLEKQLLWQPRYPSQSITFSNPKDRLFKHLSEYSLPTFYGVHRTDFLKMIYKELLNFKVEPLLFGEMLLSMLTLIYGKTKSLDVLYMARRLGPRFDYRPSLIDFMKKGKYDQEYAKFRKCLVTHLCKKSQLNIEELEKTVDDAMSLYIKKYYSPSFKQALRKFSKLYKCLRFVHRLIKKDNFLPQYGDDFNKIENQLISNKYV